MKVEIKFNDQDAFVMDENFSSIGTYHTPHSGKFIVESITSISIIGDESLYVCADPKKPMALPNTPEAS